jgi:DNA-binding transcriptional ArsR family regulator
VLASETRLRLLHALERSGELRVSELAAAVGMAPQAVSNQLQRMADRGIVAARREGSSIIYRVADPCVTSLLEFGLCLAKDVLSALVPEDAVPDLSAVRAVSGRSRSRPLLGSRSTSARARRCR